MKKTLSIALAIIMVLATFIPASFAIASEEHPTITVNNVVEGQTYSLYRILNLTTNSDHTAFSYTPSSDEWEAFFLQNTINGIYVNVDAHNKYVTWITGASAAQFARIANAYAKANNIDVDYTRVAGEDDASLVFEDVTLGYYLLDSSLGALCGLSTTTPDAVIDAKNTAPIINKEVKEGTGYTKVNDANIGDTIEYRVTITAYAGAENYVLHDKMAEGIVFKKVTGVTRTNNGVTNNVATTNYVVRANPDETRAEADKDGCTFEVEIKKAVLDTIQDNEKITIYYEAELTQDAHISNGGNENVAVLTYGLNNKTAPSKTLTYTWDIPVYKYAMEGTTEKALKGAKFLLYYQTVSVGEDGESSTTTYYYVTTKNSETGDTVEGWTNDRDDASVLTSDALGEIHINGIDSGTYYLEEITAPSGYNLLSAPVIVTITSTVAEDLNSMTCALSQNNSPVTLIKIENKTGVELPKTGGMGTTVLYVVGGILVVGAAIVLVTKRKVNSEEA